MSARGLSPQTVVVPFGVGLHQKMDPRALQVPSLTRALDVAFTETAGLQLRHPYSSIGASIYGGGTIADCRRIVENGNELLLFTETQLYSWSSEHSAWVLKGTHLAAKIEESPRFVTTGDQLNADRAELDGTIVYAWMDGLGSWVAASDKATGAVLVPPTSVSPPALGIDQRPRVVALATKILLFTVDPAVPELHVRALDPASVLTGLQASGIGISGATGNYDATRVIGTDTAVVAFVLSPTTSYKVATVTAALAVTSTTKARACAGPIAVSSSPTGTQVQVVRVNTTNITGDLLTISTLADVFTAQAIGTSPGTPDHVTAAHRSVTDSGQYRCYVFWSDGSMRSNWVDTGGNLGADSDFVKLVNVASRAFDHDGRVYLWTSFTAESSFFGGSGAGPSFSYALQNTYFLYRDDEFLVAKAAAGRAGSLATAGYVPGVASTGTGQYAFCGIERRIIPIGGAGQRRSKYGARAPRDIVVTFDSNEARRCARLGQTLYITGGEILQYDGTQITEVGFHIYPFLLVLVADSGTGDVADGTYAVRQTLRWDNATGDLDRSTTATHGDITMAAGPGNIEVQWANMPITHKTDIAVETWRTAVNPQPDAPFYLTTSKDPAAVSNPNRYLENDPTTLEGVVFTDALADEDLTENESSAENGGLLEPLSPPAATIITATADRLFLAGVAGDPHRVWYSRQRQDGEVASFHDALTVDVPRAGGLITAIAIRDGVLYVWRETACYAFPGDGFDNFGGGQNFGPSRLVSADVGCVSMEAVAPTDTGFVFKSSKGWYALQGASVQYIGDKVSDYDSDTIVAVHVLEGQHQVRCLSTARMLVYDTFVQQWAEWTISEGLHAALWNGTYHYVSTDRVKAEQTTYSAVTYSMDVETADIPIGSPLSFGRVWKAIILGEFRTTHRIRVRLAKNYATTYFQDKTTEAITGTAGDPLTLKHSPSIQEMHAIRIRLSTFAAALDESDDYVTPAVECLKLTFLVLELGVERHLTRHAAQSQ